MKINFIDVSSYRRKDEKHTHTQTQTHLLYSVQQKGQEQKKLYIKVSIALVGNTVRN